ncbi:MAG: hypothetical protein GX879_07180 [Bacteroidales bacterium]|nr:hypothetical protein [Bacteroidales bacterium]
MQVPDKRIIKFLKKHHVFSLATCNNNIPWLASCFYVYDDEKQNLVFVSNHDTRHFSEMLNNSNVSANIYHETKMIGKIRGVQISGKAIIAEDESELYCKSKFYKRFPYVRFYKTRFWILEIETIKMTDNRLGFGKKLYWYRNDN